VVVSEFFVPYHHPSTLPEKDKSNSYRCEDRENDQEGLHCSVALRRYAVDPPGKEGDAVNFLTYSDL
jgi:hypothetical protein